MSEVPILDIRTSKDFTTFMKSAPATHYEMEMKMAIIECLSGVITSKLVSKHIPVQVEFDIRLWEFTVVINKRGFTPRDVKEVLLAAGEGSFTMTDEDDKPFAVVRYHLTNQIRSGDISIRERNTTGWIRR